MTEQIERLSLLKISERIIRIDDSCELANYSLTDANELDYLAGELKRHAKEIRECCS